MFRLSHRPPCRHWHALPPEIRELILEVTLLHRSDRGYTSFEKRNFHRLILHQSGGDWFNTYGYASNYLGIPAPLVGHPKTHTRSPRTIKLLEAIWQILKVLILELSAHSPSDSKHAFPGCSLHSDIYPHLDDENCTYEEMHAHMSHKCRRTKWHNDGRGSSNRGTARVFRYHLNVDFKKLRDTEKQETPRFCGQRTSCPPSFFEDHSLFFHIDTKKDLIPSLGAIPADDSCSLEHLSVAFFADAKDFFQDFWPGYLPVRQYCEETVTHGKSSHLTGRVFEGFINKIGTIPGPLYRSVACIFQYGRFGSNSRPKITLSSTQKHSLEPRVVSNWDVVANKHTRRGVLLEERVLAEEGFESHDSVIELLELRRLVLQPVSACQLKSEAESSSYPQR
ncbi:hypothetical protein HD806DRAFT_525554 [Xylariaceae sp. AK1471]|nr:hypothetical protein HD806DRAFT_525554 [Xylariaceae sp. AK1471]